MALSDFPFAAAEIAGGGHDATPSHGIEPLLPYKRNASNPGPGSSDPGIDAAVGLDLNVPRPSVVNRARLDKTCRAAIPETVATTRRRLLWEVWDGYHCSICGTCLSLAELGKIAAKVGLQFEPDESEHAIHGHFVQLASKPGRVSKLTQKVLDRKYRNAIERFRRAKSEEQVAELWDRALTEGDIPGPYWALTTHPRTSTALMMRAFGEVHMLSHLAGATNRADIRRLRSLEGERQELSEQLAGARRRSLEREAEHRRFTEERDVELRDLTQRLQEAQAAEMRLEQIEARLRNFEDGEAVRALRARNTELESALDESRRELESESQRRSTLERELSTLRSDYREMRSTVRELNTECNALESLLESGIDNSSGGGGAGGTVDLCGRRVAYVGGRAGIVSHFRALVERLNGHFLHHDGGIEDHEGQLGRTLGQADVVLCPVDCVSHRASLRAKRFCKRTSKPFVPLRSAGLSSFVTGLQRGVTEFDRALEAPSA